MNEQVDVCYLQYFLINLNLVQSYTKPESIKRNRGSTSHNRRDTNDSDFPSCPCFFFSLRADGLHTSSAYQEIGKGAAKGGKATSRQNTEPNAATKDMKINQGK
jgi:hypothetical protein